MKHTLKSLLITSVLTLPSVFGAATPLDGPSTAASGSTTSDPTQRAITAEPEQHALDAFRITPSSTFEEVIKNMLAQKIWTTSMTPDEHAALIDWFKQRFDYSQLQTLKGLLPLATAEEIAKTIAKLSLNNEDKKLLYTRYALHPNAALYVIRVYADYLREYIGDFHAAADLYQRAAHHRTPKSTTYICSIARDVESMGAGFHNLAADLFVLAASHTTASEDIKWIANHHLRRLGFNERADALLKKYGLSK